MNKVIIMLLVSLISFISGTVYASEKSYLGGVTEYNKENYNAAFRAWYVLAQKGDAESQYGIGKIFLYGLGKAPKDPVRAYYWLNKSRSKNISAASYLLGEMYYSGVGVKQDISAAVELYEESIRGGNKEAIIKLAYIYKKGGAVKSDPVRSKELFDMCADQGNADCQLEHCKNLIESNNLIDALKYCKAASAQGDNDALMLQALIYSRSPHMDLTKAVNIYRSIIEQKEKVYSKSLVSSAWDELYHTASLYIAKNKLKNAQILYEYILSGIGASTNLIDDSREGLVEIADNYVLQGDLDSASDIYNEVRINNINSIIGEDALRKIVNVGDVYYSRKDLRNAKRIFYSISIDIHSPTNVKEEVCAKLINVADAYSLDKKPGESADIFEGILNNAKCPEDTKDTALSRIYSAKIKYSAKLFGSGDVVRSVDILISIIKDNDVPYNVTDEAKSMLFEFADNLVSNKRSMLAVKIYKQLITNLNSDSDYLEILHEVHGRLLDLAGKYSEGALYTKARELYAFILSQRNAKESIKHQANLGIYDILFREAAEILNSGVDDEGVSLLIEILANKEIPGAVKRDTISILHDHINKKIQSSEYQHAQNILIELIDAVVANRETFLLLHDLIEKYRQDDPVLADKLSTLVISNGNVPVDIKNKFKHAMSITWTRAQCMKAYGDGYGAEFIKRCGVMNDKTIMYHVAKIYDMGIFVSRDIDKALLLYGGSSELGLPESQIMLCEKYAYGRDVIKDALTAREYCGLVIDNSESNDVQKKIANKILDALIPPAEVAEILYSSGQCNDALDIWRTISSDDAEARFNIAKIYFTGECVGTNIAEAISLFDSIPDDSDKYSIAKRYIGIAYLNGYMGNKDLRTAQHLFEVASNYGDARSITYLGYMLETENVYAAIKKYMVAEEKNDQLAMVLHANLYRDGVGEFRDRGKASSLYSSALSYKEDVSPYALSIIAEQYEKGTVFPADTSRALTIYQDAASLNDPGAQLGLCRLALEHGSAFCNKVISNVRSTKKQRSIARRLLQ